MFGIRGPTRTICLSAPDRLHTLHSTGSTSRMTEMQAEGKKNLFS